MFLLAALILPFSNGRWMCAPAGIAGPIILLLFLRKLPKKTALVSGFLILTLTSLVSWISVNKVVSGPLLYAGALLMAVLQFVPYSADILWRGKNETSFFKTFYLPLAWVAIDTVFSLVIADQGSIAYSQFDNLPLLQVASITGMTGITFLIGWTTSVVSWFCEGQFKLKRIGVYIYVAVILSVIDFGYYRLGHNPPEGNLIPVAAVTSNAEKKISAAQLIEKSTDALGAGAKIILWSEVLGDDLTSAESFARENAVFLFAAVGIKSDDSPLLDNKVVLINPIGETRLTYRKSNLSPGEASIKGEKIFKFTDTLSGRLGTAICADFSFSAFMRAAGQNNVDIVFDPASEWPEVARIQTATPIMRAVENGFNLVKATHMGASLVADYTGRIISETDAYEQETLIASVPNRGTETLYSQGGWLFSYFCLVLFLTLAIKEIMAAKSIGLLR